MIYTEIPLKKLPNQTVSCTINNQNLTLSIYVQENDELYMDVYLGATVILSGMRCNTGVSINQYNTQLNGYLTWVTLNNENPLYTDFGTNAHLLWSDLPISYTMYIKYVADNLANLRSEFG